MLSTKYFNPNNVVDVAFKLLIDNIELVDKLFKFVFVAYPVKSGFKEYNEVPILGEIGEIVEFLE